MVLTLRTTRMFLMLMVTQAAHSIEEYDGRLWENFPPARFVSGLVSSRHGRGFLILNVLLLAFGFWCYFWPVRRQWPAAMAIVWIWVVIEIINGIVHPAWALQQGHYVPGVLTAPFLLVLALVVAREMVRSRAPA
jgi:hypothetical protein